MTKRTVLIVDDETAIRRALRSRLTSAGYAVLDAADGQSAVDLAATAMPDAIVLDLGLPDVHGTEVVRQVRKFSDVPIVILSAVDADDDKVAALDAGADDYVTKPFSIDELMARLRALLRRADQSQEARPTKLRVGRLVVDLAAASVTVNDAPVRVTPTEWALLVEFVRNPGKLLTHRHLIEAVWGGSYGSEASSLRIYVSHLRRLIEDEPANPAWLLTEPGAGYRLCGVELA